MKILGAGYWWILDPKLDSTPRIPLDLQGVVARMVPCTLVQSGDIRTATGSSRISMSGTTGASLTSTGLCAAGTGTAVSSLSETLFISPLFIGRSFLYHPFFLANRPIVGQSHPILPRESYIFCRQWREVARALVA